MDKPMSKKEIKGRGGSSGRNPVLPSHTLKLKADALTNKVPQLALCVIQPPRLHLLPRSVPL
jgi:hypothetical protein